MSRRSARKLQADLMLKDKDLFYKSGAKQMGIVRLEYHLYDELVKYEICLKKIMAYDILNLNNIGKKE